jgi:predicted amidohydrolase
MQNFKAAICQNLPGSDKQTNVENAIGMIREAAAHGARLVMLPEMFFCPYELEIIPSMSESDGATLDALCRTAREAGIYLCTGSMAVKEGNRIYNRAYLLDPHGDVLLTYDKSYLFDVELPGLSVRESSVISKGNTYAVADTELGRIGILICYDIRFPESGRALARKGAEIILVPAAFNNITGPAHWHVTLRARAIENQCYVAAASPAVNPRSSYAAYGHSLVADPWGTIIAEAGTAQEIIYSEFDAHKLTETRERLPLLKDAGI